MKSPLAILGLFVAAAAVLMLGAWPAWNQFSSLRAELRTAKAELQNKQHYMADVASASKRLDEFPNELAKLDSSLPDGVGLPALYDLLSDFASASGLKLKSVSSTQTPGKDLSVPRLTVADTLAELTGSYAGLKEFLGAVKRSPRVLRAESVSFGSPKDGLFSFRVRLSAFSY